MSTVAQQRTTATLGVAALTLMLVGVEAVLLLVAVLLAVVSSASTQTCGAGSKAAAGGTSVASFSSPDAAANAQTIVLTTAKLGLSQRAAVIAVATAMDESSLIVLDHGDLAGPDSRGLFQQRASWGSVAQRMDPATSTTLFLTRMITIPDWQRRALTEVAHTVQGNSDPNVYAPFEAPATTMVTRFWPAGTPVAGTTPSAELAADTTAASGGSAGPAGCPGTGGQTKVTTTSYPVPGGGTQPVDVAIPLGAGPGTPARPAIVMVHGGGFYFGNRAELADATSAAADHGYIVLNIDYDLAAPRWPRELDQVRAAVAFARASASTYGIDPARIALLGDSAGGTLVSEAALTGDHTGVQAVVSWSGAYDFLSLPAQTAGGDSYQLLASIADPTIYLGCPQLVCPDLYRQASPALSLSPGAPPAMLVHSDHELVPLAQHTEMVIALHGAAVPVNPLVFPGDRHATAYTADAAGPTLAWLDATLHFTPPPPPSPGQGGGPPGYVAPSNPQQAAGVGYALAQLGKPYVYGATGPDSFDCSGLMLRAWQAAGITLPRTSQAQSRSGEPVAGIDQLQPGDLVFIAGSDGTATDPGHVGMYIGGGQLVNAPEDGVPVRLDTVARWQTQIVSIRRPGALTNST